MTVSRPVLSVSSSVPTREGAGVRLRRAVGHDAPGLFDPFLLLDDFRSDRPEDVRPGFPWHPHRGIETVTIMLEGEVAHGDSLGNRGVVGPGAVQWMTAGSGIVHEEMPRPDAGGRLGGFQLWVNLPAAQKMCTPRYQELAADEIPVVEGPEGEVRVISGAFADAQGSLREAHVATTLLDIRLRPDARLNVPLPNRFSAFAFVYGGAVHLGMGAGEERALHEHTVARLGEGDAVTLRADSAPARLLLAAGEPLDEPIAWGGPVVMNTREELERAFAELRSGDFLRHEARDRGEGD